MATIVDVAKRAGVSITTVSRVMNQSGVVRPELVSRVMDAVKELHYQPNTLARSLRRSESFMLGALIPDNRNPFYAEIAQGIEDACFALGFSVVLCNTHESAEKIDSYFTTLYQN